MLNMFSICQNLSECVQAVIALHGAGLITRAEARAWLGIDADA
jgi:hypothetical protein